jgi:hypothetical protein
VDIVFGAGISADLSENQYSVIITLTDYTAQDGTELGAATYETFISASSSIVIDINKDGSAIGLLGAVSDEDSGVYVQGNALYHWTRLNQDTKVPSGSTVIDLDSSTESFSEIMIVAEILRSNKIHVLTATIPSDRITTTAKEIKLGGGEGTSTGTNCGAWGNITTTDFEPVVASINNATFLSDTDWYIYGR